MPLGGPKQRMLVAALLANDGHPATTDRLIEALWGEHPPATATKTLQKYVSQLRKELGGTLATHPGGYALELDVEQVDARRFAALVESAGSDAGPAERVQLLEQALELWRGDPYPELEDPTSAAERTRLAELRLSAIEELMEAKLDRGEHRRLVGRLEALVAEHPLRERLWGQLMLALYRAGRQSEALRAYQRLRRALGTELGIEPSPELQELEDRILRQEPGLAPAAPARGQTNLKPGLTSFVGRAGESQAVDDLLGAARLVTLVGPGGSGKTRLATEVAAGLVPRYPDGVWFVDLAPLTSPDQVADAVAAPLGVGGHAERPTELVLKDYLRGRRLLLVVDNCEHVVGKVGALLTELLQADAELTVLATSRELLGVPGEVIVEVPPLSCPEAGDDVERYDAVRLFLDRAAAADPHFRLTESNAGAVAELCRRLDGIPLAVELAAARVRSFHPQELIHHLDRRFGILTSPLRSVQPRHQSLQAAVDWSYDLLDPTEQTLFRRLSVFRGGFTMDAARDVCGFDSLEPDLVTATLPELVDRSLVTVEQIQEQGTRYRLLETLREYGRDAMAPAEATAVRDAHAAYFLALSEEESARMHGPGQVEAIHRLSAEHGNLRAALRWTSTHHPEAAVRTAIGLADFWDAVGPRSEGHEWLARAATLSDSLTPELRIAARLAACELFSSAHASISRRYAEEALAEARRIGDELGEARALRALSFALMLGEQPEEAAGHGRQALRIFERMGDPWEIGLCLERVAEAEYPDPERAIARLERSVALYRQVGDRNRESAALRKLANIVSHGPGDPEVAAAYAAEAVAICEEVGNLNNRAHAQLEHGKVLKRLGDPDRAVAVLGEALEQLSKSGDERCTLWTLVALGMAHLDRADEGAAMEAFHAILRRGGSLGVSHIPAVAIAGVARVLAGQGELARAAALYGFANKLRRDLRVPVGDAAQQQREERLEALRLRMGGEEFERARHAGEAMDLEDAVAFALAAVPHGGSTSG